MISNFINVFYFVSCTFLLVVCEVFNIVKYITGTGTYNLGFPVF